MVFSAFLGFELPPLVIVAVALLVILVVGSLARTPANIPPYPARPYPILGHLPYLGEGPRDIIMEWSKTTGEIFSLYFGTTLVVVLSSYDILKETLVKQADIFSDKPLHGMFPIVSKVDGIIESSGARWKENRSTVLSILREFGMGKNVMAAKIEEEVHAYLDEIKKMDGKPVDLKDLNMRAVSNIICSCLLGKRFEYDDSYYKRLLKVFDDLIELASSGSLHMWFPLLQYVPGDLFKCKLLIRNEKFFDEFRDDFKRKAEDDEEGEVNKHNVIAHYLNEMRARRAKGQPTHLSEVGVRQVMSDLMVAGTETTATTLMWFNLYMIHNPEVLKKVHEEIDDVIGQGRNPQITDRPKMVYLNAAIMETQRIASIVPLGLMHRCTEETTVRGYTIPKDTFIMPHLDSVLLSEKIWGDPHNFRPERFIDSKGNLLNPEELTPFSLGRRLCLGESMAKAELFLFISHIYQRYTIVPEDPHSLPTLKANLGLTNAPFPHKIRVIKRDV